MTFRNPDSLTQDRLLVLDDADAASACLIVMEAAATLAGSLVGEACAASSPGVSDTVSKALQWGQGMASESNRAEGAGDSAGQGIQAKPSRPILRLPERFRPYASQPLGGEHACVAGAVAEPDGSQQQPVVALSTGKNRVVSWARHLDGLEDAYQARATHCVLGDGVLYVLLQTDTQSQRALSQTLLSVAKLDLEGEVLDIRPIHLPGLTSQAYSAYVEEMPGDFRWSQNRLRIKGHYFLMSDMDTHIAFSVDLGPEATP